MATMKEGKEFERIIANALKLGKGYLYRLMDATSGYANIGNPCDFFYHLNGVLYCLECKTVQSCRMSFDNIQDLQLDGLIKANKHTDIWGGFLIYYRGNKVTQLVNVETVRRMIVDGRHSISMTDPGVVVPSAPMQVMSKYYTPDVEEAMMKAMRKKMRGML